MPEDQRSYVTDIFTSGQHLLSLINDILDLSKIEAGKMTLDLEMVSIPQTLENSLSVVKEKAFAHRLKLDLDTGAEVAEMYVDPRKFKQIIYNLLANAVKFTPDGGSVSVVARRVKALEGTAPDSLEISVTDTGIGMSSEGIKKLFRAFEQLDGSVSRKFEGTGLGLVMVKRLVELHDGSVTVTSEPDQGSCFTVVMPYLEHLVGETGRPTPLRAVATDQATEAAAIAGRPMVLVIEDDDQAADLLRLQLEGAGYRTVRAANSRSGLALVASERPDLITLDIMMPEMDGWEFLSHISKDAGLALIPVVIISIVGGAQKRGIALGAAKVLQKPVHKEELMAALADMGLMTDGTDLGRKVLVVDDDPRAVDIVARHLEDQGFRALRAYGGQQAIDMAAQNAPELITLDLMMPEVSGFDVVEALRVNPHTAAIPIIILTAKVITAEDLQALQGKVLTITQKDGFRPEAFLGEVQRAFRGRAGQGKTVKGAVETETKKQDITAEVPQAKALVPEVTPAGKPADGSAPLVLVVEDNPKESALIRLYLEDEGYRVAEAANGTKALELMLEERPDLITLDLMMPEMDGFAFLDEKAKVEAFKNIPVVIASGIADGAKGAVLGANSFLRKPIKRHEMLNAIAAIGIRPDQDNKARILLIDDDPKAITIMSSYFDGGKYAVDKAYSGREGLTLAASENRPDIIVLDLMMPEMNGFEVLDKLKANGRTRDIPVIILTAKILTREERDQLAQKVQVIVEKGQLSRGTFLAGIRTLLRKDIGRYKADEDISR